MKRIEDYFKTPVKKKKMDPEQNVSKLMTVDIAVAGTSGF